MIDFPNLRAVHVTCVAVSYALFVVRGVWMIRESPLLRRRWVKVVPHIVDIVLLASAIAPRQAIVVVARRGGW